MAPGKTHAAASERSSGTGNLNMKAARLNPHHQSSPPQHAYQHQIHVHNVNAHNHNYKTTDKKPPSRYAQIQQPPQQPAHVNLAQATVPARNLNSGPTRGPGGSPDQLDSSGNSVTVPRHRTTQPYPNVAPLHHVPQQPQSRTLSGGQSTQQPYPSPNLYTTQPSLQSPFLNNQAQFQSQQPPTETSNFYPPTQSPRSQHSGAGTYYPAEKSDSMAATATMQRPYPPIYHTPQSNSPASVTSPQTHDPGRPMYSQAGPQMYGYGQYGMNPVHQPAYGQHHPQAQHQQHQMNSQSMLSYQSTTPQMSQGQVNSHHSAMSSASPKFKPEQTQHYQLKSEPSQMKYEPSQLKYEQSQPYPQNPQARPGMLQQQQQHSAVVSQPTSLPQQPQQQPQQQAQPQAQTQQPQNQPQAHGQPQSQPPNLPPNANNAAPGPIPATTPLVVKQDNNGVHWIAFEYSRDRVKMEYTIRCDVESVDANALSPEFKSENCVYPRACVPKEQYKGNRLGYETECNQVGWALAELNQCLRGKRGLIQRAVDSWRNSNQDPKLRSRRVRRQAKMNGRSRTTASSGQAPGSAGSASTGLPGQNAMAAPTTRPPGSLPNTQSQILHHPQDVSPTGHDNVGAHTYNPVQQAYRQNPATQHMASPTNLRQGHVFAGYPSYPTSLAPSMGPSMAPSMQPSLHHLGRPGGNAAMASKEQGEKDEEDNALFGELPEGKRRKFILVEDTQKNARVRVKVTLDQIEMSEIPDSYRKQNSVFPRAYFPVQMQIASDSMGGNRFIEEGDEVDGGVPTLGRTSLSVKTSDGEADVDVPFLSKSKKGREQKMNELGYRMAWGQGRVFSSRPIFLARALDAYRSKQRSALLAAGSEPSAIPAHLESRPGKRKWLERTRTVTQAPTPPNATAD